MATLLPDNPKTDFIPAISVCPVPPLLIATVPEIVDARILVFKEVILAVLDVTFVFKVLIDAVLEVMLAVLDVMLFVADVILVSKVAMVDELTPPTEFTVGTLADPLKSPDKSIIPFVEVVASVGV